MLALSKVAVADAVVEPLVIANPMRMESVMVTVVLDPTWVQVVPSADLKALIVLLGAQGMVAGEWDGDGSIIIALNDR